MAAQVLHKLPIKLQMNFQQSTRRKEISWKTQTTSTIAKTIDPEDLAVSILSHIICRIQEFEALWHSLLVNPGLVAETKKNAFGNKTFPNAT